MVGAEPFVVLHGEDEMLAGPVGGPTRILARAETTSGSFTALENVIPAEQGPPEHVHVREDEMYYVFEGAIRFKADGRYFDAPQGLHVHSPGNASLLPEHRRCGGPAAGDVRAGRYGALLRRPCRDAPRQADQEAYRQVAHAAWMEVVGPPMEPGEGDRD